MIGQFLGWLGSFFSKMFKAGLKFIGDLFGNLFQKLFDLLKWIFNPVFILIAIIFYFLYKIAELLITLFLVFVGIGKVFFALVKGIFKTLAGFTFTPTTRNDGQWTSIFQNVVSGLDSYQLDVLAYVLLFLVWFVTGFAAIRILRSIKNL